MPCRHWTSNVFVRLHVMKLSSNLVGFCHLFVIAFRLVTGSISNCNKFLWSVFLACHFMVCAACDFGAWHTFLILQNFQVPPRPPRASKPHQVIFTSSAISVSLFLHRTPASAHLRNLLNFEQYKFPQQTAFACLVQERRAAAQIGYRLNSGQPHVLLRSIYFQREE